MLFTQHWAGFALGMGLGGLVGLGWVSAGLGLGGLWVCGGFGVGLDCVWAGFGWVWVWVGLTMVCAWVGGLAMFGGGFVGLGWFRRVLGGFVL